MNQSLKNARRAHVRGVWLEDICNSSNEQTANKSVVPNVLPAFLHVLLARLNTEEVPSRRIVVVAMVGGADIASRGEALDVLGAASNAASAEAM
jgi:hypothetical protein